MRRRLLTLASAVSLLLSLASSVLWVRSRSVYDNVEWAHFRRESGGGAAAVSFDIYSKDGGLWVTQGWGRLGRPGNIYWDEYYRQADATGGRPRLTFHSARPGPWDRMLSASATGNPYAGMQTFGPLHWARWGQNDSAVPVVQHNWRAVIPDWLAALVLAILPGWVVWRRAAQRGLARRGRRGLCPACGYDLRATPDRCPECGTPVPVTS